jgi:hypothetical protein
LGEYVFLRKNRFVIVQLRRSSLHITRPGDAGVKRLIVNHVSLLHFA